MLKKFWHQFACFQALLDVVDVMTVTRRHNGATKCMKFSMQKLIFEDSGSLPFFSVG